MTKKKTEKIDDTRLTKTERAFRGFRISEQLALPITFVTSTQAILGKKGGGKSYKASVECEELLEHGQQVVVLDPTGAWWGLRSSADGDSVGYPITIFGGEHADVPLESTAGEVLAEAIVADGFSALIDLTSFTKGEEQRFCAAFLEALYRRNKRALHLFLDEADVFAPQRPFGDEARTLGACQSIVRRGRIKGIGCTLITQRPQVLNKDVLSQVDMLTVLRMNHPKDLGAIDEWVGVHGDPKMAKDMMASLPSLPKGEAWVWAPGSDIFDRITFRDRRTYDSGRTPKPGEKVARPRVLAHVDLERIGETIRATVERAKATDPKAQRARADAAEERADRLAHRVTELEKALAEEQAPALSADQLSEIVETFRRVDDQIDGLTPIVAEFRSVAGKLGDILRPSARVRTEPTRERAPVARTRSSAPIVEAVTDDGGLPPGEAKILRALIQYRGGLATSQLSVLVGYKRSARNTYVSRLVAKGFVERSGDRLAATAAGKKKLPHAAPLPVGKALREECMQRIPEGERNVLEVLIRAYPSSMRPDEILSVQYKRSARNTYLSRLVARELVTRVGREVKASDTLFGIDE